MENGWARILSPLALLLDVSDRRLASKGPAIAVPITSVTAKSTCGSLEGKECLLPIKLWTALSKG